MPLDDLQWALDDIAARAERYALYRAYYNGEHRLLFATEKFKNAFGDLFQSFADNLCGTVVDAVADRLEVAAFEAPGAEAAAAAAWEAWERNRMDRRSGDVHSCALREADAFVVVWPNSAGEPRIWPQNPQTIAVRYDDDEEPDRVLWAAKAWRTTLPNGKKGVRANLYYPERIEKWVAEVGDDAYPKASRFTAYEPLDGTGSEVVNPYAVVPVFHFANGASDGSYGRSELADVLPLQDGLNKAIADMLVAMEFHAYPQRWMVGVEVERDPETGKALDPPFKPGADRIWSLGNPEARFGQFDPAALSGFLSVQDSFRAEIARVSGTPMHYLMLSGEFPSGEAMKTAEARLVKKVEDRQTAYGNVWEDVLRLCVAMAGGQGDAPLSTIWESAESRDERLEAETATLKKELGVSTNQILRELGYTPDQIEQMAEEREVGGTDVGEALLRAFDRGGTTVPVGPTLGGPAQ